jgi:uncharacterized protein YqgC (DUF456 family)
MLDWLYYVLLLVVLITGWLITILSLPGLWLMVAAAGVFAWVTNDSGYVSVTTIVVLAVIALLAEIAELLAGAMGAQRAGASKRAMLGAIVGGFFGALLGTFIPIPIVGNIIGACIGCFLGALGVELGIGKSSGAAFRVGTGAAVGRLAAIVLKLGFGIVILLIALIACIPIGGIATSPAMLPTNSPGAAIGSSLRLEPPSPSPATIPSTQPSN